MKEYLAIFDLDGTLFDTSRVNFYSYEQALREHNFVLDYNYFCQYCNGRHYTDFLPQIVGEDKEMIQHIHERKKELYSSHLKKARPNEHLFRVIEGMNAYNKAVVTTASRKNCLQILDYFGKTGLFDLIITHEDITRSKPDPQGFKLAMERFKIGPENTVIYEDADVGIEAARCTGAAVFAVKEF